MPTASITFTQRSTSSGVFAPGWECMSMTG